MTSNPTIHLGDAREVLKQYPDGYFDLIVTSPPYADARKKHYSSIGTSEYPDFFASFHDQFWRVLNDEGSMIINIKDKVVDGVRDRYVWKTILKLNDLGWRSVDDYIWTKPNAMPGHWRNRLRDEWEYCFHLTKQANFKMYQEAVKKPVGAWAKPRLKKLTGKSAIRHNSENASGFGRDLTNWLGKDYVLPGNTLSAAVVGKNMGHPAVFPPALPEFFIKLFTQAGNKVLDPFAGSGTTGFVSKNLGRECVLIDNEPKYVELMQAKFDNQDDSLGESLFSNPLVRDGQLVEN